MIFMLSTSLKKKYLTHVMIKKNRYVEYLLYTFKMYQSMNNIYF